MTSTPSFIEATCIRSFAFNIGRAGLISLIFVATSPRDCAGFALNPFGPMILPRTSEFNSRLPPVTKASRSYDISGHENVGEVISSIDDDEVGFRKQNQDALDASCETRRDFVVQTILASLSIAASVTLNAAPAQARDELFKPNPLTNSVLEQMRILNQDEADNLKYGGELTSGSSKPRGFDEYVQLLLPIIAVDEDLAAVDDLVHLKSGSSDAEYARAFRRAGEIMSSEKFDKLQFKKNFNAFADNIYYSDPDRANLYLGGGAVPKNTQTLAYLLRNDILGRVEDLRAELVFLIREVDKVSGGAGGAVGNGDLELGDLFGYIKNSREGMAKYLDLVPPEELKAARLKFLSSN